MAVKNEDLLPLFEELKRLLEPYAARFSVRADEPGRYELWSDVNIAPAGRPRHEPFFAGLIVQKSYVGLYHLPIYVDPELRALLGPELLSTFKGKSCFYVRKLISPLREQIVAALETGLALHESKGWA